MLLTDHHHEPLLAWRAVPTVTRRPISQSPELSGATALDAAEGLTLLATMNLPAATRGTRGRGP